MSNKTFSFILINLFVFSSCILYKDIRRPKIQGSVFSENGALEDVTLQFIMNEQNQGILNPAYLKTTKTDDKGFFQFDRIVEIDRGIIGGDRNGKFLAATRFLILKEGYITDTINIKDYDDDLEIVVDTIYLKLK
ncbi:hypothetical protein [Cellulophaga baltica]|uniref:hypothetical protein n=1 Tax=Cellulophaga baltica TaxID=76594 RepID=UPI0003FA75BC|nr:hypothetical protein [Cellulophaga baltica]